MTTAIRKYPIGIQSFEDLRTNGYMYVDKTEYIHRMITYGKPYFLARPRRFGKSLLVSTMKAYFSGQKELFEGLAMADLEKDWVEYPVFYINFSTGTITDTDSLSRRINVILSEYERQWAYSINDIDPANRLEALIRYAYQQTGRKAVVLIDEYDKPLLDSMKDGEFDKNIHTVLRGFYGTLKGSDEYLRFVFLTGITKFSKVSVFSELNHLIDISLDDSYSGICGISETELIQHFEPDIKTLAEKTGESYEHTFAELKRHYNGYRFSRSGEGMYNPFSLLNTFRAQQINNYWFETGTPIFLVKMLKKIDFDIKEMDDNVQIPADSIMNYRYASNNPVPLLYQSGYLTIKDYDSKFNCYILGFPNEEVKYGFYNELLPVYLGEDNNLTEFFIKRFVEDLQADDIESFMVRLKAHFSGISFELENKHEKHYQTILFVFFKLLGQYVRVEECSAKGRADIVLTTQKTVFVFELKMSDRGTAEDALQQIDDKGYLSPYFAEKRKLVKIGIEFSEKERGIGRWLIEEIKN